MKGKEADAKKSLKQFFTAERPDAYTLEDLRGILRILRSDEGCPWDRKQTFETMVPCVLEEAGEVAEAVRNQDTENLCEELGDLLFRLCSAARWQRSRAFLPLRTLWTESAGKWFADTRKSSEETFRKQMETRGIYGSG